MNILKITALGSALAAALLLNACAVNDLNSSQPAVSDPEIPPYGPEYKLKKLYSGTPDFERHEIYGYGSGLWELAGAGGGISRSQYRIDFGSQTYRWSGIFCPQFKWHHE